MLFNGYQDEDITSNGYLFGMWYYIKTNDASLLLNIMSDNHYDTDDFYRLLEYDIREETDFFNFQKSPFNPAQIKKVLQDEASPHYRKHLGAIMTNLYLHEANRKHFPNLHRAIKQYMDGDETTGINLLTKTIANRFVDYHQARYTLKEVKGGLLARGAGPATNDYLKLSLKAYLDKYGDEGSFTLWPEVHSYLRLSLNRRKKTNLASISKFWTKYYQRKDYSLSAVDQALTVFEQKNCVQWPLSVKLITEIQEVSEKGYRGLLAGYIMEHEPAFILSLLDKIDNEELRINWFDLEPGFISVLPEHIYRSQLHKLLNYHRTGGIPADEIINLLSSDKLPLIQKDLKQYGCRVTVKEGNEMISLLEKCGIKYDKYPPDKYHETSDSPESRLRQGTLDARNASLIKKKKLSPGAVAALSDGNYAALADTEVYDQFSKSHVKRNIKDILFYSITGKSAMGDYPHSVWALPGSILKLMSANGITIPKAMFNSFMEYISLSMFRLGSDDPHQ